MTPLPLLNPDGVTVGRAALAEAIAGQPIKQHLIHETVVAELAARRAGTHSTLTRGRVRGGGAKPWRQKGTGRARQGSIRAPQWTGGGVVFGPTPRSHGGKVNRKVRQQAFRAALRAHADRGSAALMDATGWETPSTKRAAEYLRQASDALAHRPLLLVVEDLGGAEARSFRNLAGVDVLEAAELQTVDLVAARAILVERSVWERLAGGPTDVEAVEPKPKPKRKAKPKPKPKPKPAPEPVAEEEAEAAVVEEPEAAEPEAAVVEEPAPAEEEAPAAEEAAPAEEAPKPKRSRAKKPPAEEAEPEAAEPEAAAEEEEPTPKPKPRAKKPAAKKPAEKAEAAEPEAEEEPS
jgi:large subunit ribosomal protein L4